MIPTRINGQDIEKYIQAKHDRVVIKRDPAPTETAAGLSIAHLDRKMNTGVVLSRGKRCEEAEVGQHVLFGRNSGTDIKINGEEFTIMHEADLMMDLDKVQPFDNKVLLKPDPMPEMIKSIIIPLTVEDVPKCGHVIAIGPNVTEVTKGERVLIGSYAGVEVSSGEEKYLMLREQDCFAGL